MVVNDGESRSYPKEILLIFESFAIGEPWDCCIVIPFELY